jgi:hypothetical protein
MAAMGKLDQICLLYHKQHHHRPSLELRAPDAMFIFLIASTSEQQSPRGRGVMLETPTLIQAPAIHRVADFIC